MRKKIKYEDAECEIVLFDGTDVLTTSTEYEEGNDGSNIDGDAWH